MGCACVWGWVCACVCVYVYVCVCGVCHPCIFLNWLCWPSTKGSVDCLSSTGLWGFLAKWEINNVDRMSIRVAKWFERLPLSFQHFCKAVCGPFFLQSSIFRMLRKTDSFRGRETKTEPSDYQTGSTFLTDVFSSTVIHKSFQDVRGFFFQTISPWIEA